MIFIAGVDNYINVSMDLTTFLGAVFGFIVLLLVFFLYINRKWCFNKSRNFECGDESTLPSKYIHQMAKKRPYEVHTSSDSEDEILRRLRLQQQPHYLHHHHHTHNNHQNQNNNNNHHQQQQQQNHGTGGSIIHNHMNVHSHLAKYGPGSLTSFNHNHNLLHHMQQIPVSTKESLNDPLGVAERGKVGMPPSSSECSSNSSILDASFESSTGLIHGVKKDRRLITSSGSKSFDSTHSTSTTLRETKIDNRIERSNSISSGKYHRLPIQHQDSLDDVPDFGSIHNSTTNNNNNINDNNQDCIVVLSQEPALFDTSDLKSIKSEVDLTRPASPSSLLGRYGSVEISLLYDAPMRKMTVHVLQARGIPSRDRGQSTHTQVRLLMLPSKKQKHKTKIRSGENPQFIESFLLHRVNPEEVNSMGLRVRVYGCERMRRERLIGESIVSFAAIDLDLETNLWLQLEPRANTTLNGSTSDLLSLARSDSTGSTTSMQHGGVPELLLGLAYNGTTGRLTVEVVKGSHFRNLALNKAPDTYVKLCLVSSLGQEMARAKTSTRRGQPNPLFKETFVFQVALFQLNDVTLMISIYTKRNMKRNEMVGWFSLGLNSSGPEEMAHWIDMRELTRGELLARWHILVDS